MFHYQHIDAAAGTSTSLLRFQLQFQAAEGLPYEPISKPWAFEFVPGAPGDLLLVQEGSCRILYASLPKQGADSSDVFLFGSHTGKFATAHTQHQKARKVRAYTPCSDHLNPCTSLSLCAPICAPVRAAAVARHTAPVRCLRTNGNAVFSGCERGVLKLWSLADGQLTDTVRLPDGSSVTAITSLGPLLVSIPVRCWQTVQDGSQTSTVHQPVPGVCF